MQQQQAYPNLRPIADTGVLVEFGNVANDEVHQLVLDFDSAVRKANVNGLIECVPTSTCVLVSYDPLQTDCDRVCEQLEQFLSAEHVDTVDSTHWDIPVCYAESMAPDLDQLSDRLGLSAHDIVEHHSAGRYKIIMYGFAPGYAYMGGVPEQIRTPRKTAPVMNVPPQTVMIAGPQCLITTLPMPTGWWRIGMTTFKPLQMDKNNPFIFNVGDSVEFVPMNETDFLKQTRQH